MKNTEVPSKNITFPEREFKKSAQKSRNLHFGSLEHLPDFALSRVRILCFFVNSIPERVSSRPGPAMPRATCMAAHLIICLRDCVSSRMRNPHGSVSVSWTDPLHSFFTKRYLFCFKSKLRLQSGRKCEKSLNPGTHNGRSEEICMHLLFILAREFACEMENADVTSKKDVARFKKQLDGSLTLPFHETLPFLLQKQAPFAIWPGL